MNQQQNDLNKSYFSHFDADVLNARNEHDVPGMFKMDIGTTRILIHGARGSDVARAVVVARMSNERAVDDYFPVYAIIYDKQNPSIKRHTFAKVCFLDERRLIDLGTNDAHTWEFTRGIPVDPSEDSDDDDGNPPRNPPKPRPVTDKEEGEIIVRRSRRLRPSSTRLWCFKCLKRINPDSFSDRMRKQTDDAKRFCLAHTSTSDFNRSADLKTEPDYDDTTTEGDPYDTYEETSSESSSSEEDVRPVSRKRQRRRR